MKNILIPEKAIRLLKSDPLQNVNILNFIEENPITDFQQSGNSILIKGISDREWIYISSSSETEFNNLLNEISDINPGFAVVEDWQIPLIQKKFNIKIELSTIKYYLPEEVRTHAAISQKLIPLSVHYADYIYRNSMYKEFTAIEYIQDRLIKGISCGLLEDNKLAAWAITHDDGAIGFLHVLDDYRGKGYAINIMNYMISKVREREKIPFAQIEGHNLKSINLVKKLGFREFKRVHWVSKID